MEQRLKLLLNSNVLNRPHSTYVCLILLPVRPSRSLDLLVAGSTESFLLFFER